MKEITFGTSFSPEYAEYIGDKDPLETLRTIRRELNIQDFRLGLRWNTVEKEKEVSLAYYEKYLDYLLNKGCKICINIGPIKVMRWPEEHIPSYIDVKKRSIVKNDSDIAKYAIEYLFKLLELLKRNYGEALSSSSQVSFQIENECYNRFGHKRLLMSDEYLLEVVKILNSYYPQNNLMMDSAARKDLRRILHFFKIVTNSNLYSWEQLRVGLNYYSMIPETLPFSKRIEALTFFLPWSMPLCRLKSLQKKYDFGLEISEAQFEPWGVQTEPGNSLSELEYILKNVVKIFPENYSPKLVRLWGTEEFALKMKECKLTVEHENILKRILS